MINGSNLFIRNIPSIQKMEFNYRTPMSSSKLNEMQHQAYEDLLDLFNKANELHKMTYEMNLAAEIESICYDKRMQETRSKVQLIDEHYTNLFKSANDYKYLTRFAYQATIQNNGRDATVDKNRSDIIPHIMTSTSKIRLYDETYDEALVPTSLHCFIGPDLFTVGGDIYSIEDSDVRHAVDGNLGTVWMRKVVTSSNVDHIDNELVIALPEDVITSRAINFVSVNPFPFGYIDIMDVMYKVNGAWTRLPGFESHDGCEEYSETNIFGDLVYYKAIRDSIALGFAFPDLETNQIKIKLRQRHFDSDGTNKRVWYLGIRDIDVNHNIYTRDESEFDMEYEFTETQSNIQVYDAEVYFNNKDTAEDTRFHTSKEYFYYDSNNNPHKVTNTAPFILKGHKMKVRYHIDGVQNVPNIYKTRIKYKLV